MQYTHIYKRILGIDRLLVLAEHKRDWKIYKELLDKRRYLFTVMLEVLEIELIILRTEDDTKALKYMERLATILSKSRYIT